MTGSVEVAQLLGGRRRVLLTVIAALHADGRLAAGPRRTLTVSPSSTAPAGGIERVVWKALANPRPPATITAIDAVDQALGQVRRSCQEQGLMHHLTLARSGPLSWTAAGRALVEEARARVPAPVATDLALSIAVHGGEAWEQLARSFARASGIVSWAAGRGDEWAEGGGSDRIEATRWGMGP